MPSHRALISTVVPTALVLAGTALSLHQPRGWAAEPEAAVPNMIFAAECGADSTATVWPVSQSNFGGPPIDDAGTILEVFDVGKTLVLFHAGSPAGTLTVTSLDQSMEFGRASVVSELPCEGLELARSQPTPPLGTRSSDWGVEMGIATSARGSVIRRSPNWKAPAIERRIAFPSVENGQPGTLAYWYSQTTDALSVGGPSVLTQSVAVASQAAGSNAAPELTIDNDSRTTKSSLSAVGLLDFDGDGSPELVLRWESQDASRCSLDGFRVYSRTAGEWGARYDGVHKMSGCP